MHALYKKKRSCEPKNRNEDVTWLLMNMSFAPFTKTILDFFCTILENSIKKTKILYLRCLLHAIIVSKFPLSSIQHCSTNPPPPPPPFPPPTHTHEVSIAFPFTVNSSTPVVVGSTKVQCYKGKSRQKSSIFLLPP